MQTAQDKSRTTGWMLIVQVSIVPHHTSDLAIPSETVQSSIIKNIPLYAHMYTTLPYDLIAFSAFSATSFRSSLSSLPSALA